MDWENNRPRKAFKPPRVKKIKGVGPKPMKSAPPALCVDCDAQFAPELLALRHTVIVYKKNKDGLVYPLEAQGTRVIGPTRCFACAAPEVEVREQRVLAPVSSTVERAYALEGRRVHVPRAVAASESVALPAPIPGEANPIGSDLGFLRGRVMPKGKLPQNPWDRAPRDNGRRDFESPVEGKALKSWAKERQAEIDLHEACRHAEGTL